jgi:hypothetical protein
MPHRRRQRGRVTPMEKFADCPVEVLHDDGSRELLGYATSRPGVHDRPRRFRERAVG